MRNPFTLSTAAPFLWMSSYLLINLMGLVPVVEAQTGTCATNTSVCATCNDPAGTKDQTLLVTISAVAAATSAVRLAVRLPTMSDRVQALLILTATRAHYVKTKSITKLRRARPTGM